MQVSVETLSSLSRKVTVTIPASIVEAKVTEKVKQLAKTRRIDGFRPGKVPLSIINKRFGPAVRNEVTLDLMEKHFGEAVTEKELIPLGQPKFEFLNTKKDEDLQFSAQFEVYPEIEIQGVEALEIEKSVVSIRDEDLDNMMQILRKQHAKWEETTEVATAEDKAIIDFTGKVDGETFEGGTAENFAVNLNKSEMIPGFAEGIVGLKVGDKKILEVNFPEDYHVDNLKGKPAVFDIKVNKIEREKLPEIDGEFAKLFNIENGDLEELKVEVKKNMQRELDQALEAQLKNTVLKALKDKNDISLPEALIDQEIDQLKQQSLARFGEQGAQNLPDLPKEIFMEQAKERVHIGLLVNEVIRKNELTADVERVKQIVETTASAYENPTEVVEYYNNNESLLANVKAMALEQQTVEFLMDKAKVTEVERTFDEIMNPKQPG